MLRFRTTVTALLLLIVSVPSIAQQVDRTWSASGGPITLTPAEVNAFGLAAGRVEVNWTPTAILQAQSQQLIHIPQHFGLWIWEDGIHGQWFNAQGEGRLWRARWGLPAVGRTSNIVITWDTKGYAVIIDGVLRIHDWQTLPYAHTPAAGGVIGSQVDGSVPATGTATIKVFNTPVTYNACLVDTVGTINENPPRDNSGAWSQGVDPDCADEPVPTGEVELAWIPPTEKEDGSALTDLAGYKIYWGTVAGSYPNSVTIEDAGATGYTVTGLPMGTYYFVATAYLESGIESVYSNVNEVELEQPPPDDAASNPPGSLTVVKVTVVIN